MGCVLSRGVSSGVASLAKEVQKLGVESDKADNVSATKNEAHRSGTQKGNKPNDGDEKKSRPNPRLSNPSKNWHGEQVAAGWPSWLSAVCGEALNGWIPRRADTFEKIEKIGSGTYSNVYKAKDMITGKIVALKKVRFDTMEPESVKFMAREILILRRLDHQNVIKLEGLATSRMTFSLYLVFEYMPHDLAGLAANPEIKLTEPEVKCFTHQLLSGIEHCHQKGVLHRDLKGSNLLINDEGVLKIADFGLASFFDPNDKHPMTNRVVTLWYRAPELLLGTTNYGVGIDLWSAGCILAELLAGKPIMPGRTEVEQLHKIYKLCGSPSEEYWKKAKLPHGTVYKPREPYKRRIAETFKDFPASSLPLIETLLAFDPAERQTATAALKSEFFTTEPYACEPSSLPKYPPSKEMDAKRRDNEARRQRAANKAQGDNPKKQRTRPRAFRGMPAPEANAELKPNIDRRRLINHANAKSKSEKFPPPHQDGALGYSHHIDPSAVPTDIPVIYSSELAPYWTGPLGEPTGNAGLGQKKLERDEVQEVAKLPPESRKDRTQRKIKKSKD